MESTPRDQFESAVEQARLAILADDFASATRAIRTARLLIAVTPNLSRDGFSQEWRNELRDLQEELKQAQSQARGVVRHKMEWARATDV
jgi:hypothetical protein